MDEEDDDIAVIPTQGGGNNFKCPITTLLMENPYRNKVCGHTYEYDAILNHLRKDRRGRCPVAGCNCQHITEAHLEKDARTANLIRREKVRRQHAQDLQRGTQDTTNMDAEDDDIAVVPTQGGGNNFKCPITTLLMENPYRNKVCGHTYEYDAILNHLRKDRRGRCPVAGCNCQRITEAHLEKDARTANLIRREKVRRQHAQDLQRATQDTTAAACHTRQRRIEYQCR